MLFYSGKKKWYTGTTRYHFTKSNFYNIKWEIFHLFFYFSKICSSIHLVVLVGSRREFWYRQTGRMAQWRGIKKGHFPIPLDCRGGCDAGGDEQDYKEARRRPSLRPTLYIYLYIYVLVVEAYSQRCFFLKMFQTKDSLSFSLPPPLRDENPRKRVYPFCSLTTQSDAWYPR